MFMVNCETTKGWSLFVDQPNITTYVVSLEENGIYRRQVLGYPRQAMNAFMKRLAHKLSNSLEVGDQIHITIGTTSILLTYKTRGYSVQVASNGYVKEYLMKTHTEAITRFTHEAWQQIEGDVLNGFEYAL